MTTREVLLVKPEFIPDIWFKVKPLIDQALDHSIGELHSSDIMKMLLNEEEFLWVGMEDGDIKSVLVSEIINYPRKRILRIIIWTVDQESDFDTWIKYLYKIEDFARTIECSHLEAWARKGLTRKLNWDHEYTVISKPIKPKQQRKRRRRTKSNG